MKRLLVVLLFLVIGVVALGFYLDWFHVSTDQKGEKSSFTIEVDKDKIRKDTDKAEESIKEKTGIGIEKAKDKGSQP